MSQIDRIITTLNGLAADGELAQAITSAVERHCHETLERADLRSCTQTLTERYVVDVISDATQLIMDSGGGLSEISAVIHDAYRIGLEQGLSVGIETCPERSFGVR